MRPALWLVAYDIASPRRLRRVAARLEQEGRRLQRSIFECVPEHGDIAVLRARLTARIDHGEDRLLLQPVCRACRAAALDQGSLPAAAMQPYWIV